MEAMFPASCEADLASIAADAQGMRVAVSIAWRAILAHFGRSRKQLCRTASGLARQRIGTTPPATTNQGLR
jgi:hypothetical protein